MCCNSKASKPDIRGTCTISRCGPMHGKAVSYQTDTRGDAHFERRMPYYQAYEGKENGCNGWYENGIYKAVIKVITVVFIIS